ncbi:MAG: hypothetical protein HON27_02075 [Candidatus Marinimicrobia bacterium]|nr:hypothetical protein [Candidatus Neomarinimicrobiota bacterium]MBT5270500.1 hypothetical protein [Candidatus Neomarinimicrobiota bacterium]
MNDDFTADTLTTGLLTLDSPVSGVINFEDDMDWFALDLTDGMYYQLSLDTESDQIYFYKKYNINGTRLNLRSLDNNSSLVDSNTAYISVYGADDDIGTYQIALAQLDDDYSSDTNTTGVLLVDSTVDGEINYTGDEDVFAVQLLADHLYRINTVSENEDITSAHSIIPATDGTHYISVSDGSEGISNNGSQGTYQLSITETYDDYSSDVNTTGAVMLDSSVDGEISLNDVDWISVELIADQAYQFDLTHPSSISLTGLYDSTGELVESLSGKSVVVVPDQSDVYYVSIGSNWSRSLSDYQLTFSEVDDDFTHNSNTNGVVSLDSMATGEINYYNDVDWFSVDLSADQIYTFDLTGDEGFINGVYNSVGEIIGNGAETIPIATDTYYVSVKGYQEGAYQLSLSEINDDFSANITTTGELTLDSSVTGNTYKSTEEDWFAVELIANHTYQFDVSDGYFYGLYDSSGGQSDYFQNLYGPGTPKEITPTASGTYYLSKSGGSGDYELSVLSETLRSDSISINGVAEVDETLTVNTSLLTDVNELSSFSYQWYREDTAITGATDASFVLTQEDEGASLTVEVGYTNIQDTVVSIGSMATTAVAASNSTGTIMDLSSLQLFNEFSLSGLSDLNSLTYVGWTHNVLPYDFNADSTWKGLTVGYSPSNGDGYPSLSDGIAMYVGIYTEDVGTGDTSWEVLTGDAWTNNYYEVDGTETTFDLEAGWGIVNDLSAGRINLVGNDDFYSNYMLGVELVSVQSGELSEQAAIVVDGAESSAYSYINSSPVESTSTATFSGITPPQASLVTLQVSEDIRKVDEINNLTGRIIAYKGTGTNVEPGTEKEVQMAMLVPETSGVDMSNGGTLEVALTALDSSDTVFADQLMVDVSTKSGVFTYVMDGSVKHYYYHSDATYYGQNQYDVDGNLTYSSFTNAIATADANSEGTYIGSRDTANDGFGNSLQINLEAGLSNDIYEVLLGHIFIGVRDGGRTTLSDDWGEVDGMWDAVFTLTDGDGATTSATKHVDIVADPFLFETVLSDSETLTFLDNNSDEIIDKIVYEESWEESDGTIASDTGGYSITWNSATEWTANALHYLQFTSWDIDGTPLTVDDGGSNISISWQERNATTGKVSEILFSNTWIETDDLGNETTHSSQTTVSSFDSDDNGIPDTFSFVESEDGVMYTGEGVLINNKGVNYDGNIKGLVAKVTSSDIPEDVFSGEITVDNDGNITDFGLPDFSDNGGHTGSGDTDIAVTVNHWSSTTSPIAGVTIQAGYDTDSSGQANLAIDAATTVMPTLTADANAGSAVNLQDAIMVLKQIVGLETFNDYQAVAADFDSDGNVGIVDAVVILKHVVGLPAPDPEWVFMESGSTTPLLDGTLEIAADSAGVELVGVLLGDVDGSWEAVV